jgi:phosphate transport system substrate-binding protein
VANRIFGTTAAFAVAAIAFAGAAEARDQVKVAGSSTVLPYANIVAEQFGKVYADFKTPIIESGGSSADLKLFCQGIGPNTIDIANASRKIRSNEVKACGEAGVKNIVEVSFGYDGIVFATDVKGPSWELTPKDVYLGLAKQVPVDGKMVDNPNKTWKDVNDKFPAWDIVAYIPGEKHGTREVFEDKLLEKGCEEAGAKKIMMDGGTVDIDGDYTETLGRLQSNKTGVGVFGLSFYENNIDKLKVATINGVTPSDETISTGKYPVSRPLYFYVKKDHVGVIPGLKEYVEFFTSEKMIGEDGPRAEYGLVPTPEAEHEALLEKVKAMKTM